MPTPKPGNPPRCPPDPPPAAAAPAAAKPPAPEAATVPKTEPIAEPVAAAEEIVEAAAEPVLPEHRPAQGEQAPSGPGVKKTSRHSPAQPEVSSSSCIILRRWGPR